MRRKNDLDKVCLRQKRAARTNLNKHFLTCASGMLQQLNGMPLIDYVVYRTICFIQRATVYIHREIYGMLQTTTIGFQIEQI